MRKPICQCWDDPDRRWDREQLVDRVGQAMATTLREIVYQNSFCTDSSFYLGGAAVAAIVMAVAFDRRGDGEVPTAEEVALVMREIVESAQERLNGERLQDLDQISVTGAPH